MLEEEILNADVYQFDLDDRIAFLTEFLKRAKQVPPVKATNADTVTLLPPTDLSVEHSEAHTIPSDTWPPVIPDSDSLTSLLGADNPVSKPPIANSIQHNISRFPKLSLPTFSGDSIQWQTFWDSFDAVVHSNSGLSGVQKFNYLRAQLHGDAACVVAGFPLTDTNYVHSVDLLKNRFGQPYKIINAHMEALLNLTKPTNNLASLQVFHNTIERHMRSLSALGKSSESYGMLLTSSILSKLPADTKWHMVHDYWVAEWSIEDVMPAIRKEIQAFEMSQQYNGKPSNHDSSPAIVRDITLQCNACACVSIVIAYCTVLVIRTMNMRNMVSEVNLVEAYKFEMVNCQLPPPNPMVCTGNLAENWKAFKEAFNNFTTATQLRNSQR